MGIASRRRAFRRRRVQGDRARSAFVKPSGTRALHKRVSEPPSPMPCSSLQLSNEGKRNLLLLLKQIATTNFLLIRSFSQIRAKYVLGLEMQKFWQESSCRIRGQITKIFGFKIMEFTKYYVHYARMAPARGEMVRLKLPSYSQLISLLRVLRNSQGCC